MRCGKQAPVHTVAERRRVGSTFACNRRPGHDGQHRNRYFGSWDDRCSCGDVTFVVGQHAMCMNCGGHNPRCGGLHCPSHPWMLGTAGRFGIYCYVCG